MELIILGTGYGTATHCYNTCFALREGDEHILVDAGGGSFILNRLEEQHIDVCSIHHIIVTHSHSDHILGVNWVLRLIQQAIAKGKYRGAVHIYGCKEVLEDVKTINGVVLPAKLPPLYGSQILFEEIHDGESRDILGNRFTFFDLASTKQIQFGHVIRTKDGKTVGVCGDEPLTARNEHYMEGADWLLHEAFCLCGDADRFHPYEKHHSTVKDACQTAERLHIRNLLLYHTEDTDLAHRKERYTAEGKTVYSGGLFVPDDGERFLL